jgi:hypothetical protein
MDNSDRYDLQNAQHTIVSVASSRSKHSQLSREALTLESFIPEELISETQYLMRFFEEYYQWMNQEGLLISAENEMHQVRTGRISDSTYSRRNPDVFYDSAQSESQMLFDEVARNFPNETAVDFRTVLKHILTLYRQKGGEESIQSFFRILYNITSSVYYPWDDVLIASAGQWDGERFISNKGFLSDRIHLQDSDYWQRFSYDIKVGIQEEHWRLIYEALIHPSGFKFFASFILILTGLNAAINKTNGQVILLDSETLGNVFSIMMFGMMQNKPIHLSTILQIMYVFFTKSFGYMNTFTELAFYNPQPMEEFDSETIDELIINNNKIAISTLVTITP